MVVDIKQQGAQDAALGSSTGGPLVRKIQTQLHGQIRDGCAALCDLCIAVIQCFSFTSGEMNSIGIVHSYKYIVSKAAAEVNITYICLFSRKHQNYE